MIGIIVTGHGKFAEGFTSAIEVVLGKQDLFIGINFPSGDTKTELEENIENAISSLEMCENIIVFADLLSGTPFNAAIMKAMKNERIRVIYGTNFGMLIEAVMNRNTGMELNDIVKNAMETGKNQIGVFDADIKKDVEDDEL
jgi:PTS system N-acetylgalactosamine-specific IIA component